MRITKVVIRNFKAISETTIHLTGVTVIVGANGSGKSSVLQALHWMFQSGRNPVVKTNKIKNGNFRVSDGSTLSEKDATYMPSPEYRNAGHSEEYGNKKKSPQMEIEVHAVDGDGSSLEAYMWINPLEMKVLASIFHQTTSLFKFFGIRKGSLVHIYLVYQESPLLKKSVQNLLFIGMRQLEMQILY